MNSSVTLGSVLAFLIFFTVGQQIVGLHARVTNPDTKYQEPPRGMLFRMLAAVIGPGVFILAGRAPLPFYVVGVIIMTSGLWLGLRAQSVLGRNWVPGVGIQKGHKLVDSGPYRYVRHPIYTGIGVIGLGATVSTLNPFVAASFFFLWLSLAIRTPFEEMMMAKKFKTKWTQYEARTGYFLPRIRK